MDEEGSSLEKYIKYSVDELETLRESYVEKISECVNNQLLTVLQEKFKINLYRLVTVSLLVFQCLSLIALIALIILSFLNVDIILDYIDWIIGLVMVPLLIAAGLSKLLDDGSIGYRLELRNIDLILKKKKVKPNKKIMLDSNILDDVVNGTIRKEDFGVAKKNGYEFFITHIQVDEINECKNEEKRKKLNLFMAAISPKLIATESVVLGFSRLGFAKMGDGEKYDKLKKGSKNIKKSKDALIGETALKKKLILLSNDKQLRNRICSEKGQAISIDDFKKLIQSIK